MKFTRIFTVELFTTCAICRSPERRCMSSQVVDPNHQRPISAEKSRGFKLQKGLEFVHISVVLCVGELWASAATGRQQGGYLKSQWLQSCELPCGKLKNNP